MKICFVASSGGHWEELCCLKEIAMENAAFYVTEKGGQTEGLLCENTIYTFPQINRKEKGFWKHFFKLFLSANKVLKLEKPDMVITTGALLAYPFCLLMKLRGGKVVYIESFARVHDKSLTGKLVYPIADEFFVQWESMLECYPKAKYMGGLF